METPEQSVERLRAEQEADKREGVHALEEVERLRIENLQLKQEVLLGKLHALEVEMGERVAEIRERLDAPEEKYNLVLARDLKTVEVRAK